MKHLTRHLLPLVLALVTMGVLLTSALAAQTDRLILTTYPDAGAMSSTDKTSTFVVIADIVSATNTDVTEQYDIFYSWFLNDEPVSDKSYYTLPSQMGDEEYILECSVWAVHKTDGTQKTADVAWYLATENVKNISLTVTQNLGNYYFDDSTTESGTSVLDEICELLDISSSADLRQYEVSFIPNSSYVATFNGESTCALTDLDEAYLSLHATGKWVTQYTVTKNKFEVLTGLLTIDVAPYVGLDAFYSATPGDSAVIDADVFYDFWENNSTLATLDSIRITSVSGLSGTLCYDHDDKEKIHTFANGLTMYTDPTNRQSSIEDLTFFPSKTGGKYPTGSVTVSFLANGTDNNKKSVSLAGNIVILYTNAEPSTLSYDCTGTYILLNSDDFDAIYRTVTNTTTKNPSYTVRFLDLPAYGTLYRGYSDANYGTFGSTALTDQNRAVLSFSSNGTGESSLDNLAYVPLMHSNKGDSARYVVYANNKPLYVGTIQFTSRELVITYTTSADTLTFSSSDFFTSNSPLIHAQYLMFGNPSSGTLYKDYENGTRVQSRDYFSYNTMNNVNLLDNVTFVPKEGFLGTVEIPFTGHSLVGGSISGKVRIYVVRHVFEDVDPNNWAAPYINRLYATGIISGTSATTFSPNNEMKYGEALKMILIAAGYPKQSETGGTHWASNYLNLAYQNGIVATKNIDLNAKVDRNTIAEIAAKALGLNRASSVNSGIVGPSDSDNGYVFALYNAGILNGTFINGHNYFEGSKNIERDEVAKIICAINDYQN